MRSLFLLLTAVCAILGAASPIDKRQPESIDAGFTVVSAESTGLAKRFGLISGGKITINGVVYTPGSEPFPGIFIGGPGVPICYAYCLNPKLPVKPVDYRAKCKNQGCPTSAINPKAFYVVQDNTTSYKGDRLKPCKTGQVCADAKQVLINTNPVGYPVDGLLHINYRGWMRRDI